MMSKNHNMMRRGRGTRLLPVALAGLGLVLSGCLQPPPKQPTTTSQAAPILDRAPGAYKVGNPYQVGKAWYYPKSDYGYDETGIASWYGPGFHGKSTANGETFDQNALTAAHRTLPMPSMVRVTNLENGRSIKLRINDRGPFKNGRIIDLSRRAADLLGFRRQGTAKVRVEIVGDESRALAAAALTADTADTAPDAAPRTPVAVEQLAQDADATVPATRSATPAASQTALAVPRAEPAETARPRLLVPKPDGIVTTVPVQSGQIYVQAGSRQQAARPPDQYRQGPDRPGGGGSPALLPRPLRAHGLGERGRSAARHADRQRTQRGARRRGMTDRTRALIARTER
jgi:rare lipoprotein A